MSNQEAIALLRNLEDSLDAYCELNEEGKTAFRMAIEALSCSEIPNSSDLISRQAAIDALHMHLMYRMGTDSNKKRLDEWINNLPSAQPEKRTEERTGTHTRDLISRKKVRYKLTALVNELEEIFANIRERNEDDSVCGLCEYDGAYIGQSGDWCNECPGFDKSDCFKLKDKYRHEWEAIDE